MNKVTIGQYIADFEQLLFNSFDADTKKERFDAFHEANNLWKYILIAFTSTTDKEIVHLCIIGKGKIVEDAFASISNSACLSKIHKIEMKN